MNLENFINVTLLLTLVCESAFTQDHEDDEEAEDGFDFDSNEDPSGRTLGHLINRRRRNKLIGGLFHRLGNWVDPGAGSLYYANYGPQYSYYPGHSGSYGGIFGHQHPLPGGVHGGGTPLYQPGYYRPGYHGHGGSGFDYGLGFSGGHGFGGGLGFGSGFHPGDDFGDFHFRDGRKATSKDIDIDID